MTHVLIVDDREDERFLLGRRLRKIDSAIVTTEVESAAGAETALSDASSPFDVMFLDVSMPVVSGIEFLDRVKTLRAEHEHLRDLVVVMYTSFVAEKDEAAAAQYEFVRGFLAKDADMESIRAGLNAALD